MNPYITVGELMDGSAEKKMDSMIKSVMSHLGAKGRGKSKIRGNKKYYQHIVKIREIKRKARKIEDEAKEKIKEKKDEK